MTVKTAISIDKPLFKEAEALAQALNMTRSRLFGVALAEFVERQRNRRIRDSLTGCMPCRMTRTVAGSGGCGRPSAPGGGHMVVRQGDVFWVELGEPTGSAPGYRHPHVVIQNNLFNRSRLNTVVVVALTSNLQRVRRRATSFSTRARRIFRSPAW